jgi:hypothetical protein
LTTFAAFVLVLLDGMVGVGSAATISEAARSLAPSAVADASKGSFVVVPTQEKSLVNSALGLPAPVNLCWVSNRQLGAIRTRWETTTVSRINTRYSIVTVYGPTVTVTELRRYVSGTVNCEIVHQKWAFFLPLDGAVS